MIDIETIFNEGGASGMGWSEIAAFLRCPREYQLSKVIGVVKPKQATPDYFAIGTMVHAGRAAWMSRKQAMDSETDGFIASELERVCKVYEDSGYPVSPKARVDGARYVTEYREHYSMREAPRTVAVEHMMGPFTLSDEQTPEQARTARLDDFGFYPEFGGRLAIGECKTTSATPAAVLKEYEMHGQPSLYQLLWRRAPQGEAQFGPIAGVVFDVVQKGYGGKKCTFARVPVFTPEFQLAWFSKNLSASIKASREMKASDDVPRNVTACTRASGNGRVQCDYHALCLYGPAAKGDYTMADGSPLSLDEADR